MDDQFKLNLKNFCSEGTEEVGRADAPNYYCGQCKWKMEENAAQKRRDRRDGITGSAKVDKSADDEMEEEELPPLTDDPVIASFLEGAERAVEEANGSKRT